MTDDNWQDHVWARIARQPPQKAAPMRLNLKLLCTFLAGVFKQPKPSEPPKFIAITERGERTVCDERDAAVKQIAAANGALPTENYVTVERDKHSWYVYRSRAEAEDDIRRGLRHHWTGMIFQG